MDQSAKFGMGVVCSLLFVVSAWPAGIPQLNLADLVTRADLVVTGRIDRIDPQQGSAFDGSRRSEEKSALLSVDHVLKGPPTVGDVSVSFVVRHNPAGGNGYASVTTGEYRVFFLKDSGDHYEFVSPYYPFLPAAPGSSVKGTTAEERVLWQMAQALESPDVSSGRKERLLFELQDTQSGILTEALRNSLQTADRKLQLAVAVALLERNDLSAINLAEAALIQPPLDVPRYVITNLSSAIERGVKDPVAIPALASIAQKATDVESRRAAMYALRRTNSPMAIAPLARGLSDPDFEVRYYAVVGLADISGQPKWRPLREQFQAEENRYLSFWRDWSQAQN